MHYASLNYWVKDMLIMFPQKKLMGRTQTDERIIFIIERSNVTLLLQIVGWNISQVFINLLWRLASISKLPYMDIIDLLKTFSDKGEVIFKCDTKCPLFRSLYISILCTKMKQYFNTRRCPEQIYVICNGHLPPLSKQKNTPVGMEFCESGVGAEVAGSVYCIQNMICYSAGISHMVQKMQVRWLKNGLYGTAKTHQMQSILLSQTQGASLGRQCKDRKCQHQNSHSVENLTEEASCSFL